MNQKTYNSKAGYIEQYDKNGNIKSLKIGNKKQYIKVDRGMNWEIKGATIMNQKLKDQKLKDRIYCSKHNLEYTPNNVKEAMELELEFGCEIELIKDCSLSLEDYDYPTASCCGGKYVIIGGEDKDAFYKDSGRYFIELKSDCFFFSKKIIISKRRLLKHFKILGRPITFSEVLIALPETPNISLMPDNRIRIRKVFWDLTQDYDNQNNEVKDFLEDILLQKK